MKLWSLQLVILTGGVLAGLCGCARQPFPEGRIIDLTHTFDDHTIYWPTAKTFELHTDFDGPTAKGYYYRANQFCAAEHGGTHIDAPIHFYAGRDTLDKVPLRRLIGPAVVVDVVDACTANRDYQVTEADLRRWEHRHGRRLHDVIVLLRTGFGRYWPDRKQYMGTAELGDLAVADLHFPGLHPDAARWLAATRRVQAVGLDTPSIDYGQSTRFQSHVALFEQNIPVFENVANLDQLPDIGFTVLALPMKIRGGSGGPLRIVALLPR